MPARCLILARDALQGSMMALAFIAACNTPTETAPIQWWATPSFSGTAVVPATSTSLTITGDIGQQLNGIRYDFYGPPNQGGFTKIHLHVGAVGQNGPILATLLDGGGGGTAITARGILLNSNYEVDAMTPAISLDSLRSLLRSGQLYLDIHTTAFPNGELRAQLQP